MNYRPILLLALIVAAIVGAAIWFLQSQPPITAPVATAPAITFRPPAATPEPPRAPVATPRMTSAGPTPVQKGQPEPAPIAEWEMKIDQAIRSGADETQTAQILINMLPTLPAEGQAEAAQHISNLIADKDYSRVASLLRNPSLPIEVQGVLITDLMNREDPVKLPALLDVAKIPNHPHHEDALTDLQIFLDEDFGTDWAKWDAALKEYLRKQAADEASVPAPVQ